MIAINTKSIIVDSKLMGIFYNKDSHKHTLAFESINGDVRIILDQNEYGNFMEQVIESYGEGIRHLMKEMEKEIKQ